MHAALYRARKGRVKGRDWYDLIWYIQNKIPLSLKYLESCMRQAKNLGAEEALTHDRVRSILREKIISIDWESAKNDVRPFIARDESLKLWSSSFFLQVIDHLLTD